MKYDTERYRKIYEAMSPEEIAEVNRKNDEEHKKQAEAFQAGYKIGICYLCNKPFQTISKNTPCLHWLLRQCKFKKKDFPKLYQKYGYVNIAAFIRWCANQERMLMCAEKTGGFNLVN
ncbi:hypothetical protein ABTI33_18165 [Acinetobacter baumannii]|uniref:hypothetical protein n=1 Tax=Acinetobacter baumannii TaxID=470 RepID=UPI0022EA4021|nr:hypothetical protein [Acinetobacter baumannii]MDA3553505.1 hypothetical protein [Acinetobacter baumannii]